MNDATHQRKHALLVSVAATLIAGQAAAASPPPTAVDWGSLRGIAAAAYEAGPGAGAAAEVRGLSAAAAAAPGPWESLDIEARYDHDLSGPGDPGFEVGLDAVVAYRLGGLAGAREDALRAASVARQAERDLAKWGFEREAIRRFVVWWAAHARAAHLTEHLDAMTVQLAPVRAAVAQHRLTRLVQSDLEVEVARIRVELARDRRDEALAADQLGAWLGRPVQPPVAHGDERLPDGNPWAGALAGLDAHPELARLDASATASLAGAHAADVADGPSLIAGIGARQEGEGSTWGAVVVGLSLPLSNPEAADAERLRAEATATTLTRRWRRTVVAREVAVQVARWDAVRAQLEQVNRDLIAPMEARVALVERAMLEGRASLEQLVRARRDALEAHHETIHDLAELRGAQLEAEAFLALMADRTSPAEGAR